MSEDNEKYGLELDTLFGLVDEDRERLDAQAREKTERKRAISQALETQERLRVKEMSRLGSDQAVDARIREDRRKAAEQRDADRKRHADEEAFRKIYLGED